GSGDARRAERSRCARRSDHRHARRRGPPRRDGPRRPRARACELPLGRHRAPARRGLRRGDCVKFNWRALLVLPVLAGAIALFVFHGPNWHQVHDAFTIVRWEWVAAAIGLNLASVVARAVAWQTAINQSLEPPHPRFPLVFSAFSVGLFANAVL